MKYELDLQDARIEGKEEGIAEGIEINMMKQGLTPEQTAALTGLTVDEVEALRKRIR